MGIGKCLRYNLLYSTLEDDDFVYEDEAGIAFAAMPFRKGFKTAGSNLEILG